MTLKRFFVLKASINSKRPQCSQCLRHLHWGSCSHIDTIDGHCLHTMSQDVILVLYFLILKLLWIAIVIVCVNHVRKLQLIILIFLIVDHWQIPNQCWNHLNHCFNVSNDDNLSTHSSDDEVLEGMPTNIGIETNDISVSTGPCKKWQC